MAKFIPGRLSKMQTALRLAREKRAARHALQVKNNIHLVASTPSPHVMDGTKGNGKN